MNFGPIAIPVLQMLAQEQPLDDAPTPSAAPAAPAAHSFSFSDLQQGLRTASHSDPHDHTAQVALLVMVSCVAVVAMILHLRQRRKEAGPLNSSARLAWELAKQIRFPLGSRIALAWVALSAKIPMATLLVSTRAFDDALDTWFHRPTFGPLRRWGMSRLSRLRPLLFD
jgi:predicted membrane-bound mannosyltransferase